MSDQAFVWIEKYGFPTVVAVALALVAWVLFEKIEKGNAANTELIIQYHTSVIELGHEIEKILAQQTARDAAADATRNEANADRERNRELLKVLAERVGTFHDWAIRAREIESLRSNYFAHYLNQNAIKNGLDAPFPAQALEELETRLNVLLDQAQQRIEDAAR